MHNNDSTNYSKIFYSTSKYLVLKNIFMVITGILSIFIVRLLTPVEYGKWSLVWQLIGTVGPMISLGFLTTLSKFIPEYPDIQRKKLLFSQSISIVLISFSVFAFFYILGNSLFPKFIPQEIKVVKFPFMFFVGCVALINLFEGYYRGLGKFNQWSVIDGSRSIISAGLSILFILILSNRFEILFYTYFSLIFLFLLFLFISLRDHINFNSDLKIEKKIINFSLIMFSGQIVFLLGTSIDSVLLRALLKDPSQVGYYNAGIRIPKLLEAMLISPLSVPFLYYFSHYNISHSRETILEFGSKMLGIIFGFLALFLFSFADKIVLIVFGKMYQESIIILRIYSINLLFWGYQALLLPYFYSINKPLSPVIFLSISYILFFILNLILIPKLKSTAPAITTLIMLIIYNSLLSSTISNQKVKCFRNFTFLTVSILIVTISGFYFSFYISIPIFFIIILTTQILKFSDIELFKKIIKKDTQIS